MEEMNICSLAEQFSDEAAAWEAVEEMVWGEAGPVCPHCGDVGRAYFLKARSGHRTTKAGNVTYRRLWKCARCRRPFSVLVGTIFQDTKVPLRKWLMAIFMFVSAKNGVAAFELHRTLGVTNTTAWHMHHRIREAMHSGMLGERFTGTVSADEAYIGGDPKNRHAYKRGAEKDGRGTDKAPVVSIISHETGEVRSRVVADVSGITLGSLILENVDPTGSVLVTDKWKSYRPVGEMFAKHEQVDHSAGEYVRNGYTTNRVENFYSQLKRSLDGTHHHVSRKHLGRYVGEHDFRYSTCKISDSARMRRVMRQTVGRPLPYRRLIDR